MTNYTIEITDDLARAEVRINAYEVVGDYHNTCNKIIEGTVKPFASLSLSQDEYDDLFDEGENPNLMIESQNFFDNFEGRYIPESIDEFFGSLDHYATQHAESSKPSWSCLKCGATTTDPTHALIKYFHSGCKG